MFYRMAVLNANCVDPDQKAHSAASDLSQHYRIRPNYRTVRLGFSKLLGTLICGKMCIYLLRIHYKKDQKKTYLMMIMRFFFF